MKCPICNVNEPGGYPVFDCGMGEPGAGCGYFVDICHACAVSRTAEVEALAEEIARGHRCEYDAKEIRALDDHMQPPRIEGPFHEPDRFHLICNEAIVPHVYLTQAADGKRFHLHLDGRWMTEEVTEREVLTFLPILANAMAVAGGYTHHGPDSKTRNPHVTRLGPLRTELKIVPGGQRVEEDEG